MLDCCEPLEKVKAKGISFGKVVCLAHCAGAKVEAYRTNHCNIDDFRKHLVRCSTSDDCHMISSYHRGTFKQTGTGHFSPIGGYHAERDMALILDVARFKYPPHWVPLTLLWEAMDSIDEATGQHRGFMLISRPHTEPGMLYTLSCRHESWLGIAKYLVDDVPLLLKSEDLKDVHALLSVIFSSLPSDFGEFIKWVAEVRRQDDGGKSLSQEEKGRLAVKGEVLKQVQETGLFKHVAEFLYSANSCCKNMPIVSQKDDLPQIAASVCCQGAEILAGKSSSSGGYCCRETCVKCLEATEEKSVTLVSGTVVNGRSEQGLDVLVPSSQTKPSCCGHGPSSCIRMYPAGNDVITALLLALPPKTWSGIKEGKLSQEIASLVSTQNLPVLLQEEVLHLRRQLYLLKRCQENKVEEDLGSPLT
ncbi:glutathione gamma-glutamylcysteinyltransferase 1 isoform X2 [Jatropha curcas]|nr:glutathione gamma-glutamylcysteinyltransferase 1 isoform X2 [Jatropha curcas]